MTEKNPVFEKNYRYYLNQIRTLDFTEAAGSSGAAVEDGVLVIPLFSEPFYVSKSGITDRNGCRPGYDCCIILSRYLLMSPAGGTDDRSWVAYRNFKDAGPLLTYFSHDVEQATAEAFSGRTAHLAAQARRMNGIPCPTGPGYDLAFEFSALPKIGMRMFFNDADEDFSASCHVLFHAQAQAYLDAECLAMLGRRMAKRLLS